MALIPIYFETIMSMQSYNGQMPFYIGIHRYPITVLHSHPFAEFAYVIDGSGYETINGKTHRMGSRTASFLLPHHLHEIHSDPGQAIRKYCCMFDINILFESEDDSDWWKLLYQVNNQVPSHAVFQEEEAARMESLFEMLLAEYNRPNTLGRNRIIRSLLSEVLIRFLRTISSQFSEADQSSHPDTNH